MVVLFELQELRMLWRCGNPVRGAAKLHDRGGLRGYRSGTNEALLTDRGWMPRHNDSWTPAIGARPLTENHARSKRLAGHARLTSHGEDRVMTITLSA